MFVIIIMKFDQIGNENDIMYFGADTNSIRSDWIEALRSGMYNIDLAGYSSIL